MAKTNARAEADQSSLLLAALTALLVAQVLLPADALTPAQGAGLPQVMIWLLLLLVFVATRLLKGTGAIYYTTTDLAVLCLLSWHSVAAVYACATGAPRPAFNVLWEWIGMICAYFLIRQLARGDQACRALAAVMMGLAAGLAVYGYYQVGIELPHARREYEVNPDAEIRKVFNLAPTAEVDLLAKKQYVARLNSPQPYATFILANSLAGYLSIWLIVTIGVAYSLRKTPNLPWQWIALAASAIVIAGTLFLTDSRSALLATLVGIVLLAVTRCGTTSMRMRSAVITFSVLAGLAVVIAGFLYSDNPRAERARTSLLYRWQYWQATTSMIEDHPLIGSGPGDFKNRYMAYKIPEAYEEVGDPHNFILELGGTAGIPAVLAILAVLACFFSRTLRADVANLSASGPPVDRSLVAAGAIAGCTLSIVLLSAYGLFIESVLTWTTLVLIAVPAGLTLWLLWQWILDGHLPLSLIAISVVVLLIHLCAAGGIGNHGVAGSLWLLIAIALNLCGDTDRELRVSKSTSHALVFGCLVLAFTLQWTAFAPVVRSATSLSQARRLTGAALEADNDRNHLTPDRLATLPWSELLKRAPRNQLRELALEQLNEAVANDPWASQPQRQIVHHIFSHPVDRESLRNAIKEWLNRDPYSSSARREAGNLYLRLYRTSSKQEDLMTAIQFYQDAVERYPNSSILVAQLAWANKLAGNGEQAQRAATRALELDALTPHQDQKLGGLYQRIYDPLLPSRETTSEQLMRQILEN